jgi:hypothetical protein
MDFNKDTINLFISKSATILVNIFPGILILELFFQRGFLNDNINNLYGFILYLVWGLSISIIIDFLLNISIISFVEKKASSYFSKKKKNIPDDLQNLIHPEGNDFEEKIIDIEAIINIIFYCIFILFTFVAKLVIIYCIKQYTILPMNYVINHIIENDKLCSGIIFIILFLFKRPFQSIYINILLFKEFKILYEEIKSKYDV